MMLETKRLALRSKRVWPVGNDLKREQQIVGDCGLVVQNKETLTGRHENH